MNPIQKLFLNNWFKFYGIIFITVVYSEYALNKTEKIYDIRYSLNFIFFINGI